MDESVKKVHEVADFFMDSVHEAGDFLKTCPWTQATMPETFWELVSGLGHEAGDFPVD